MRLTFFLEVNSRILEILFLADPSFRVFVVLALMLIIDMLRALGTSIYYFLVHMRTMVSDPSKFQSNENASDEHEIKVVDGDNDVD
jgi:hypothetical protein